MVFITFWVCTLSQSHGDWCVAKPGTSTEQLLNNLNYACSKIDCRIVSNGGSCYSPYNLYNLASVAMNLYYQAEGRHFWNCNFDGSGLIGITDPSECYLSFVVFFSLNNHVTFVLSDVKSFFFLQAMDVANISFVSKARI